jgi:hypothetical protein
MDLYHASRDDLIVLVLAQREVIARLEQQGAHQQAEMATSRATMRQLTQQVGALTLAAAAEAGPDDPDGPTRPPGMPGLKPGSTRGAPSFPSRKRRPHGFARRRMEPTARQVHALERCPACGIPLVGDTVTRTRDVIEVPVVPVAVTEPVYLERRCPCCGTSWVLPRR